MSGEMTPLRMVSTAEELIGIRDGGGAGLWPRTAAVLGRQGYSSPSWSLPWLAASTRMNSGV